MAGSNYLYRYLSTVWDGLPKKERDRFAEVWKGYEQVFGDVFQRFLELDKGVNINNIPVYLVTRWNKYAFDSTNEVVQTAKFTSFEDISDGLDLTTQYLFQFKIDGGSAVEIDCRGAIPSATTIDEIIFKINNTLGFVFATGVFENTVIQLETVSTGSSATIEILEATTPSADAAELIFGLTSGELPFVEPRLPFRYALPDAKIKKIPSLQDTIRNESLDYYIISGPDFELVGTNIHFKEQPPATLWAKVTFIDEEMPYLNFGDLIDYRDTTISSEVYLKNLQGLWFAFWQGPRPEFIRRALYLLFNLPTSIDKGVVITKSGNVVEILHSDGKVRAYLLPAQLNWIVAVGDFVERFQPLVDGIDVFDKTNLPGFVTLEVGRGNIAPFALDDATLGTGATTDETKALKALEEHTFLPQINVNAFIRPNIELGTTINFLKNIKPLHKAFYFQLIVAEFEEELLLDEKFFWDYLFEVTPNLEINQVNTSEEQVREDYEDTPLSEMDLDSDVLFFSEYGDLRFSDTGGTLPQFDVNF